MSNHDQAFDKVDLHYRQQLSALMDGALAPDEARFLLRRLQHDDELSGCWERWQLAGEVMRGRAVAMLPAGFAARVREAIAEAPIAPERQARSRTHWARWGGSMALAASVAVVALLATRQAPEVAGEPTASMAEATPASNMQSPVSQTPVPGASSPVPVAAQPPSAAPRTVASVAVADASRRNAQRARSVQRGRIEAPAPTPTSGEQAADVAVAANAASMQAPRPFEAGTLPSSRPWPRAVLPQFGASGALTAGTEAGSSSLPSPSFYPFEPRLPEDAAEPDAGPAQPR